MYREVTSARSEFGREVGEWVMGNVIIAVTVTVATSPSISWRLQVTTGTDRRHTLDIGGVTAWVNWDDAGVHSHKCRGMQWITGWDEWSGTGR
jgi:hypothetical protein